jgi:glycosyltransferase involved in cell wall biosynthesis
MNRYQGIYTWVNSKRELQAYRLARNVIAVSHKVKRELVACGVDADKIEVIVNGVNLDEFHPGAEDRAALGLPINVPLGLFVGGLKIPLKNPDTILDALAKTPDIHVAFAGDATGGPFPALAKRLGVSDRAHFLGFRKDIPALMRASDFLVFPSRYEAGTLVVLEALASGLPVITAATVGNSDFVTEECGIVQADPNDASLLAANMETMTATLHDTLKRARMCEAACRSVAGHTWTFMANRYVDIAEQLGGYLQPATKTTVNTG